MIFAHDLIQFNSTHRIELVKHFFTDLSKAQLFKAPNNHSIIDNI